MRPSNEQKMAIEHDGGLLLKAGAGSGKTFVLVEHLVYKIERFFYNNSQLSDEKEIDQLCRQFLSQIVYMTFTRKAAGELKLRIKKRLERLEVNEPTQKILKILLDNIGHLNITTIHGFCFKLLNQGHFKFGVSSVSHNSDILNQTFLWERFESWAERQKSKSYYNFIMAHDKHIFDAILKVIKDPGLRIEWENAKQNIFFDLDVYFKDYISVASWGKAYREVIDLSFYEQYAGKGWYLIVEKFNNSLKKIGCPILLYEQLKDITLRGPNKDLDLIEIDEFFDGLKQLKAFLKKHLNSFQAYKNDQGKSFKKWESIYLELFSNLNREYYKAPCNTFSDLEYLVYKGLQDKEVLNRIRKDFTYFVVDEFQDTSPLQFSIIKALVGNDLKRLFCVGDAKQAIYGFRGGEVKIFEQAQVFLPKCLELYDNYRSKSEVVNFNNILFENIIQSDFNFSPVQTSKIKYSYQKSISNNSDDLGKVERLEINYIKDRKLDIQSLNQYEADVIFEKILKIIRDNEVGNEIAILYKNLGPSRFLISKLIENNIGFTAQIKIPLEEDPVIGIFNYMLRYVLTEEANKSDSCQLMNTYFQILGQSLNLLKIQKYLQKFEHNINLVGVFEAFKQVLYSVQISLNHFNQNIELIELICGLYNDDVEKIYCYLGEISQQKYSRDFAIGKNPERVVIMTVHSSKGLEFDHVILASTHSNGRAYTPANKLIGESPGSFKWKESSERIDLFKSPQFILDELVQTKKDFEESKRLLYVAATRAKKSLIWAEFSASTKYSKVANSWSNAFQNFASSNNSEIFNIDGTDKTSIHSLVARPFFHKIRGANAKLDLGDSKSNESSPMVIMAELSVTRLASVLDCPRKFYLQNICKFGSSDLEYLDQFSWMSEKTENQQGFLEMESSFSGKSSKQRGIEIHQQLFDAIKCEFKNISSNKELKWCLDQISIFSKSHTFIAEKTLKFEFFGHTIIGIPDLILIPDDLSRDKVIVLDYKSGSVPENLKSYWFQVNCYAYASYYLKLLPLDQSITMRLIFVDEKKLFEREMNYSSLIKELFEVFKETEKIDQINKKHCHICEYEKICVPNRSSCTN